MKRYLSPVLVPADTENGTLVSVSPDGRQFTVTLGKRRLRTDFTDRGPDVRYPPGRRQRRRRPSDWLRKRYPVLEGLPQRQVLRRGRQPRRPHPESPSSLHIINTTSRKVFKRLPLPSLGEPTRAEVVSWLNNREVVVKMTGKAGRRAFSASSG